jgi:Zn-dependent M16 (insulinase) family peptidase
VIIPPVLLERKNSIIISKYANREKIREIRDLEASVLEEINSSRLHEMEMSRWSSQLASDRDFKKVMPGLPMKPISEELLEEET